MELHSLVLQLRMERSEEAVPARLPSGRCEIIQASSTEKNAQASPGFATVSRPISNAFTAASTPSDNLNTLLTSRSICRLIGSEIMAITYGIDVQEEHDPWIATAEQVQDAGNHCLYPGAYLVDLLPIRAWPGYPQSGLKLILAVKYVPEWMPGAGFKKQARLWKQSTVAMRETPWEYVKERMACHLTVECLVALLIDFAAPGSFIGS